MDERRPDLRIVQPPADYDARPHRLSPLDLAELFRRGERERRAAVRRDRFFSAVFWVGLLGICGIILWALFELGQHP